MNVWQIISSFRSSGGLADHLTLSQQASSVSTFSYKSSLRQKVDHGAISLADFTHILLFCLFWKFWNSYVIVKSHQFWANEDKKYVVPTKYKGLVK